MCRSTQVKKPSQYLQRIAAGEGTEEGTEIDTVQCIFDPKFDNLITGAILNVETDPKSYSEAQSCSNWPRWKEAMDCELTTLEKAGTWITVPRPPDKNVVGSKWVYRVKCKANGSVDKYKARLVAQGLMQVHGVDYFMMFSLWLNLPVFVPSWRLPHTTIGTLKALISMVPTSMGGWTTMRSTCSRPWVIRRTQAPFGSPSMA